MPPEAHEDILSPPWNRTTKVIVVVFALLALLLLLWRFQELIGMLVISAILGYLLIPIINFIESRTRLNRAVVILLVYVALAALVLGGFFALGVAAFQQAVNLIDLAPRLISDVTTFVRDIVNSTEPVAIGPFEFAPSFVNWERISEQILSLVDPAISQSTSIISRFATSTVRTVLNVVFIFIISIYLSTDLPRLGNYVSDFAQQPGYRSDVEKLIPELSHIWRAYLRGQIILGFVIFGMVWIGLTILGVQNSLALGVLAGLLEFVPTLGPVVSAIVAIVVALFQPSNYMGLASWQYALLVLALMVVIQQLENNLLVPRIVGGALDLRPILVIIGVFMGASLAGILGAILAAPLVASLKLLGQYTWRKLFDLPPFPEELPPERPPPPDEAVPELPTTS